MRGLRLTLFILAFICLSAQLVRHTYVRWFEHHDTVLDKFDAVGAEIHTATSLKDLEKRYAEELEKEKAEDAARAARGEEKAEGRHAYEPSPANELKAAITDWEQKENDVRELKYFWFCGLAFVLLGLLCHWRSWGWLAITLLIGGIGEMVWWTSPSFGLGGSHQEFARLLGYKIVFTVLSLGVVLALWFVGALSPDRKSVA